MAYRTFYNKMINPNKIFENNHEYIQQLENLKDAIFFFKNNADDLELYWNKRFENLELVTEELENALKLDY